MIFLKKFGRLWEYDGIFQGYWVFGWREMLGLYEEHERI